jgi:hypothetical protein
MQMMRRYPVGARFSHAQNVLSRKRLGGSYKKRLYGIDEKEVLNTKDTEDRKGLWRIFGCNFPS